MTDTTNEGRLREAIKSAIRTLSLNAGDQLTSHTMSALESLGAVIGAEIREDRAAAGVAVGQQADGACAYARCSRKAATEQLYCSVGCAIEDAYQPVAEVAPTSGTDLEYGPQTNLIRAVIETLRVISAENSTALEDYMIADGDTAWRKARRAMASSPKARDQARWSEEAKWAMTAADGPASNQESRGFSFAGLQAYEIARALILRDTVKREHYDVVTRPCRTLIGRVHPDDAERAAG